MMAEREGTATSLIGLASAARWPPNLVPIQYHELAVASQLKKNAVKTPFVLPCWAQFCRRMVLTGRPNFRMVLHWI